MTISNEKHRQTRKRILASVYKLYVREGERMTTQMVCDDAQIGKGTLFNYFGSKELLLRDAFFAAHANAKEITTAGIDFAKNERDVVFDMVRQSANWGKDYPQEVLFSERYNENMHNSLASEEFRQKVTGMFDMPEIRSRLLKKIPERMHEYAMISASMQGFYLSVYIARNPKFAENEAFIRFASERIWAIFAV